MNKSASPQPYDHRLRLAAQCGDARQALADGQQASSWEGMARYAGRLEALLSMIVTSAEQVLDEPQS